MAAIGRADRPRTARAAAGYIRCRATFSVAGWNKAGAATMRTDRNENRRLTLRLARSARDLSLGTAHSGRGHLTRQATGIAGLNITAAAARRSGRTKRRLRRCVRRLTLSVHHLTAATSFGAARAAVNLTIVAAEIARTDRRLPRRTTGVRACGVGGNRIHHAALAVDQHIWPRTLSASAGRDIAGLIGRTIVVWRRRRRRRRRPRCARRSRVSARRSTRRGWINQDARR